ncbi:glucosamine inositolphosphorylceramide transferase family protein [Bacillus sp. USDA818B3_A]|uniref:glucosamine inositolphosphorylceramide transferase family protein n=1 Tax=Bacillus sp. USDA818B3_A TaxID=2698834 RepID=UPI001367A8A6|nr:hypothetical protein [Bacillus sp. USDA818B3_A]
MYFIVSMALTMLILIFVILSRKKILLGIWSITVFQSNSMINGIPDQKILKKPSLQASDVTDVPAEFIADPFIITHNSLFYMFFEILDKTTGKGILGLAKSKDGETWKYDRAILKENFHLSYPYVFKSNNEFYMIPESSEANKVLLYKAKNFPYEWEKVSGLIDGKYVDSSIFYYKKKWWLFAGKGGKLHLFFSDTLEKNWYEHPKSPLIKNNYNITRPGGRVIVDNDIIFRYTQDGKPNYGSAVHLFKITRLSESEYEEEPISMVLNGSNKDKDWNKDGMHTIDQIKITDQKWIVAVDGHKLVNKSYLIWKLDQIWSKYLLMR